MNLLLSFRSESLKLKRTLSIYVCVLAAAFGPFMVFMENLSDAAQMKKGQPWTAHFMDGREALCIALLPMYVILVCTLLLQIEYRDKTWKQVFTSPQRMIDIFTAKFLTLQGMILLFLIAYNLFMVIAAFGTEMVQPELYKGEVDHYKVIATLVQNWILIQGVTAIQFWLAIMFRNFIGPVAIGVAMWFMSPMMIFEFKTDFVEYHPYALTILGVLEDFKANVIQYQWYSLAVMAVFLVLGFVQFRRRKVRG